MRDLLLLVIISGLVPVILLHPWTGILTWFWIGLMNPHRLTWGFMFSAPVAQVVALVALAGLLLAKDRRPFPVTRETIMLIVFAMYVTMTTSVAWVPDLAWMQWQDFMKILLMTAVTPLLIYGERRIVLLILVMAFSIGFYGLKGGLFAIATGGNYMVWGPPRSFIRGNTNLGMAMIMVLPLLLISARMMTRKWVDFGWGIVNRWHKWIGLAMYGVFWTTAIAILATHSRGALLGLLAVAPFIFLKMKRKLTLVVLALAAVTVVGLTVPDRLMSRWQTIETYQEDRSAMQRIQAWGVNWNIAVENPATGAGFVMAAMPDEVWISYANWVEPWANTARAAHSIYFQLLGHHGFGGLAVYLLLVGFTFLTLNRIRRRARKETGQIWLAEYAWALQVGLIGYLAAGAFLDVAYFNLLYAFVALAVIMRRELEEAPRASEQAAGISAGDAVRATAPGGPRFPDFVPRPASVESRRGEA
ncbi:putative O-glycosylation ligase, exosortase A system-associated [Thioalkalivibrio denitrificans]|uniref:Putative O-glycosylation ligase, exosortase A system-associated n=1 Tax=Thioalkalivibrio denitrificans TaxID=108003 RepID=A0A1V3N6D7_9GAMM|nr:putative O-glycosylation ligase, exosortase A system-associated [Thioalkalivibrio denitrificans]OOG20659.1 putative O-glycosylation ligase, exosortase A system-associated [Thioalkalivibrio denitrificans]